MAIQSHVEELTRKHAKLESDIALEMKHPGFDEQKIAELKKEKLRIKDEMERYSHLALN